MLQTLRFSRKPAESRPGAACAKVGTVLHKNAATIKSLEQSADTSAALCFS